MFEILVLGALDEARLDDGVGGLQIVHEHGRPGALGIGRNSGGIEQPRHLEGVGRRGVLLIVDEFQALVVVVDPVVLAVLVHELLELAL